MPSSSTLMVAESVYRTPIPLYQTTWHDIPKSVIFVRLSALTRCSSSPPWTLSTVDCLFKGLRGITEEMDLPRNKEGELLDCGSPAYDLSAVHLLLKSWCSIVLK